MLTYPGSAPEFPGCPYTAQIADILFRPLPNLLATVCFPFDSIFFASSFSEAHSQSASSLPVCISLLGLAKLISIML